MRNSPDRSTKSTQSHFNVLPQYVNTRFQVLFHSPPGVLFTFPSQYYYSISHQLVFSLTEWSPLIPAGFLVSRGTLDTANCDSDFGYEVFTLYDRTSQTVLLSCRSYIAVRTPSCTHNGLGSFPFARRYLGNRCFFLFLKLLRCFSSPRSPYIPMDSVCST